MRDSSILSALNTQGGLFNCEEIPYLLLLAKDHPQGVRPTTIKDDSKDFIKFQEALDEVIDEKQILILFDYGLRDSREKLIALLPQESFTEHYWQN